MSWIDETFLDRLRSSGAGVVERGEAIAGRAEPLAVAPENLVTGNPMAPPYPEGTRQLVLAMGCFWGAEKRLWQVDGVWTTAVGYAGGWTPNPTYVEVCSGRTGHTESVLVVYRPEEVDTAELLRVFFESHDPTQGMRQGNDRGSQYRSAVYTQDAEQLELATDIGRRYQERLEANGMGPITTEFGELERVRDGHFYFAEDYHQQYLLKNPGGYDCHTRTGIACPV